MDDSTHTPRGVPFVGTRRTAIKGVGAALAALAIGATNPHAQGVAFASATLQNQGDLEVLNFGLRVESLQLAFYNQALASGNLPQNLVTLFTRVRDQENEHVARLVQLLSNLGGTRQAPETFSFGTLDSADRILQVAQSVEELGIGAYGGATFRAADPQIVRTYASITQVESAHTAVVRVLRGQLPTSGGFASVLNANEAAQQIAPFIP